MAGDASQSSPLKPRLLSDPRPEVHRFIEATRYFVWLDSSASRLVSPGRDTAAKLNLNRSPNLDDARESGQRRGIVGERAQFLGERFDLRLGRQSIAQERPANQLHSHRSHM